MERRSPTGIARERETRTNDAAPPQSHGGAPVSDRHRAGARNPHQQRRATPISRPGPPVSDRHRAGARNPHQQRRATPISRWSAGLRPASRGSAKPAPTTLHHANLTARSAGLRPASRGSAKPAPTTLRHPNLTVERRSPTGIARERETRTDDAAPPQSHGGAPVSDRHRAGARNPHRRRCTTPISRPGTPVSDRHRAGARNLHQQRCATPISRWSAGLRPASRGSAKPAPTTLRHPNLTVERRSPTGIARERETCTNNAAPPQSHGGAPVSDRHRAGARNPHQQRCATPISRRSAGLRPASRGSAKPAPTTLRHPNLTAERRSPTGIARERETRTDDAAPRQSHGQERRSPTGIARERETCANDVGPCQPECRSISHLDGLRACAARPAVRTEVAGPDRAGYAD